VFTYIEVFPTLRNVCVTIRTPCTVCIVKRVGVKLCGAVACVVWLGVVVPVAGLVRNGTRTVAEEYFAPLLLYRSTAITGDKHGCRSRSITRWTPAHPVSTYHRRGPGPWIVMPESGLGLGLLVPWCQGTSGMDMASLAWLYYPSMAFRSCAVTSPQPMQGRIIDHLKADLLNH
jgi:hypothetical protein